MPTASEFKYLWLVGIKSAKGIIGVSKEELLELGLNHIQVGHLKNARF